MLRFHFQGWVVLGLSAGILAVALSSATLAVTANWSDELDEHPDVVRPDGNVWRNYPHGEANGALNAMVQQQPGGTWFLNWDQANMEGSVPWDGDLNNKGPLMNQEDMTFQFRFKLGSDPVTDPDNVWDPNVEWDGEVKAYIDNNIFTIEQETYGTIKWGWTIGYERRPTPDFPYIDSDFRGASMQFFGKGNQEFNYTAIPWDQLQLANNQWYVGRVVSDWQGGNNPNSTISIYFGEDENSLQLLLREDAEPGQQFTQSLEDSSTVYPGDYNLTVIKHGQHAGLELDYFRAYWGVLDPETPLDPVATVGADFDEDGDVDGADFLVWQRGESPIPLSAEDLSKWQEEFGSVGSSAVASLSVAGVPEPSSVLLMMVAATWAASPIWRRWRNAS